jgi:hypothetical protein
MCEPCRGHVALHGCPDITLDFGLTDYLFAGELPAQAEEVERIRALARDFRAHGREL